MRRVLHRHVAVAVSALAGIGLVTTGLLPAARAQEAPVRVTVSNPNLKPMPTGAGLIAGRTVDAASGRPLAGTIVTVALAGAQPVRVLADRDGRFSFPSLPAGEFTLTAQLAGYAAGASGRVRPSGSTQALTLADGERLTDVALRLWRFGAIAGTVVDDTGEPIIGATVRAYRRSIAGGRLTFAPGPADATDDRGMFRISAVEPGDYVVALPMASHSWPAALENYMLLGGEWPQDLIAALPAADRLIGTGLQIAPRSPVVVQTTDRVPPAAITSDGRVAAYITQYFAGADSAADAAIVAVRSGEERTGVSFTLRAGATWNVSGVVTGPLDAIDEVVLRLLPGHGSAAVAFIASATAVTDARGRFTFVGVSPGQYVIRALRQPRGADPLMSMEYRVIMSAGGSAMIQDAPPPPLPREPVFWIDQAVTVDAADVTGLTVPLHPGARLRGRVEFRGSRPAPAGESLTRIGLALDPAEGRSLGQAGAGRGRIEADGQFATIGVPAGKYIVRLGRVPDGWFLLGVMHAGRDISSDPLEIDTTDIAGATVIFTDKPARLAGHVSARSGGPEPEAIVVVFPVDGAAWVDRGSSPRRLRSARVDAAGRFRIDDLPPGAYFVAAISDTMADTWQDPAVLRALARTAPRVEIAAGDERQVQLQVTRTNGS